MNPAYTELLSDFARHAGLHEIDLFLQTEEIVVDDITVSMYYEGDETLGEIVLFSHLGKIQSNDEQVLQVLMQANYLWAGTGGASLSLNPVDQQIACAVRLPVDTLHGEALASIIDSFVDTASFWKRWLAGEMNDTSTLSFDSAHNTRFS